MAISAEKIAGAYAYAQLVPLLIAAPTTVGLGLWALRGRSAAAWLVGLAAHIALLILYVVWVFFWTFVFAMERGSGHFVDVSVTYSVLYGFTLLAIAFLFVGTRPKS